nr:reverse transcriptase domain-containing protein [Tanacetum cinerariifolium]
MSSPNHPTSNIKDDFSSNFQNFIPASWDYVPASPGKTYSESSNNSFGLVLIASPTFSLFHDDPYMKVMHAYYAKESPIPSPVIMPPSPMLSPIDLSAKPQALEIAKNYHGAPDTSHTCHEERIEYILNHLDELSLDHIEEMKGHVDSQVIIQQDFDKLKTKLQEACAQIVGLQRKQMRHNDKITLARFRISTLELIIKDIQILILCCILNVNRMAPKRTSTSAAPAMPQAAIRQLVANRVAAALEAQAANMENTDNTNRNSKPRETPAARECTYKEFMSCQPFYFNGTEGAVGLIRWFERTELVFSRSNCTKDCKVKFPTGIPTEDALSWWNSYAKPIGIEQADKITWSELERLLTNKYCPRTEVKKMEEEFYNLVVKGNDLKTYARRFQELAFLCPNMVPNTEKLMEVFIGGLPRSIKGNCIALMP